MRTNCLPGGAEVGRGGWKDIGCEGEVIAIGSPWPGLLQMGFDALDPWVTESTCSALPSVPKESCFPRDDSISNSDLSHDAGPGPVRRSRGSGFGSKLTRTSASVGGGGPEFLLLPTLILRPLAFRGGLGVRSLPGSSLAVDSSLVA